MISALVGKLSQKKNEVAEQERKNEREKLVLDLENQITLTDSAIKLKKKQSESEALQHQIEMNALLTEKENKDLKKQLAKAKMFTGLKSNDKSDNYWGKKKPKEGEKEKWCWKRSMQSWNF